MAKRVASNDKEHENDWFDLYSQKVAPGGLPHNLRGGLMPGEIVADN